jgi:hypothetical protein
VWCGVCGGGFVVGGCDAVMLLCCYDVMLL